MHIQSFCITASVGRHEKTCLTAVLVDAEEDRRTTATVEWHDLPVLGGRRDNPAETLYAILSSLVTDFDDHFVTHVLVESKPEEGTDGEG